MNHLLPNPCARLCRYLLLALMGLVWGCASGPGTPVLATLAPLELAGRSLAVEDVAAAVRTPELLLLDADMQAFVQRYADTSLGRQQRLRSLHRAVSGSGILGLEYDPTAEGSAIETFHRETANCLAYANLFVALAREAGLDARYQWVEVRPQWTRMGERVAVRLHVNVVVHLNKRDRYMVDIDPLPSRDIAGTREISDAEAQALYHSNVAMAALSGEHLETAWTQAVRALQLAPQMSHLWVNLGAVYRRAGQYDAAESAYLHALELDPMARSAINNLVVLHKLAGNREAHAYWQLRAEAYRQRNPYYHAWHGDLAAAEGDWQGAANHYREALELSPDDANLLFGLGLIYEHLGQPQAALRYVQQAVDSSTLVRDREVYRAKLKQLAVVTPAGY